MKNGKIKLNKTKLIARVMLVVLLFSSALNLAGCGEPHVKKGQCYDEVFIKEYRTGFKVVSDSNCFPIDDITFSMYIGISNSFGNVVRDWFGTLEDVYYVVYIANEIDTELDPNSAHILDYSYIIKEISCEEVMDNEEEYDYIQLPNNNRIYKHCETITLPQECIISGANSDYPDFCLGILVAKKNIENGEEKFDSPVELLFKYFHYNVDEYNTVHIDFNNT